MSRRRRGRSSTPASTSSGGLLALSPIEEYDEARMKIVFRRRALYVIGGAILFAVIYGLLSWLKYRAYMDARYDLGNMVQAVFNTAHGHFLEITSGDPEPRQMSRLGSHVDPILALFALPWLLWPSPVMLLVGQAVIVATGAWPAYRLGTRVTRDPTAGAFLAGAYLLYPALGFLVLNEFHPVALATPLLLWAFLYMDEDRWVRAAVFLVLAAACKETVPLVIAFMGVYFAIRKRSPWPLVVTVLGAAWFAAAVWVVIPHYNGDQSTFIARYGDYGSGAGEVAKNALLHPRPDGGRPPLGLQPAVLAGAPVAARLHVAAQPADHAHRPARVRPQRPLGDRVSAPHRVPLHGARDPLPLRRGGARRAAAVALARRRLPQGREAHEGRARAALDARPARLALRRGRQLRARAAPLLTAGSGLRRRRLRQDLARRGAGRGRGHDPRRRQGVCQQQRRGAARGASRRLHLPVLRRGRLGDRRPAAPVLLRQGGREPALARARPAGAGPELPLGVRQGRRPGVQAGGRRGRSRARRPDPCRDAVARGHGVA